MVARDGPEVARDVADRAHAAFERTIVRFAVVDSGPVAFALTTIKENGVALLARLCVEPSAASRGLGSALVDDAVAHASRAGLDRIELDVRETNTRAIALYRRAGFTSRSAPWDYDGGDRLVTWGLDLPSVQHSSAPAHETD